jgi:hypothetical protein
MRNKRGQLFLIAGFVAIAVIVSLTAVVNSAKVGRDNEAFYDLSNEIDFETKQILDFGVFKNRDAVGVRGLLQGFLEKYADHISKDKVVFIYGDADGVHTLYFERATIGSIGLSFDDNPASPFLPGSAANIPIEDMIGGDAEVSESVSPITGGSRVSVILVLEGESHTYDFDLEEGQNFYFVLVSNENPDSPEDGDRLVSQG